MPANGRWDLIRRLKVNHCIIHHGDVSPKKIRELCYARVRCKCLCYKPFVKLGKSIINAVFKHRLWSVIVLWSMECRQPRGVDQTDNWGQIVCVFVRKSYQ